MPGCARIGYGGRLLVIVGMAPYFGAVLAVSIGIVRYVGVPMSGSTLILVCTAGLLNPIAIQLVWRSALLWLRYYIPKGTIPKRRPDGIARSYVRITVAVALSLLLVFV